MSKYDKDVAKVRHRDARRLKADHRDVELNAALHVEFDELFKHRPKKRNTRRWCRGVPGREHDWTKVFKVWATSFGVLGRSVGYWVWTCSKCGRQDYGRKDPGPPTAHAALARDLERRGK